MPDRSLYLANSYAELRRRAATHLADGETLLVAANRSGAEDLLRSSEQPGFLGVHCFTLAQLAARIATQSPALLTPLSQLSQEALVARVVFGMRKKDRLSYFHPVADRPGFVRALARTLTELRLENTDPRTLAKSGEPGRDLSLLLRDYTEELQSARLADLADLYQRAIEVLQQTSHALAALPLVLFDIPVRFAVEKAFLRELIRQAPSAHALTLAADTDSAENLRVCLGTFPARAQSNRIENTASRVRRLLFQGELAPPAELDESLQYFSSPGEGLECVEIARRIRSLGVPFERVAVLLRSPEQYQPLLEEAFRRASIPVYFARGSTRPNPAGRAFLALLLCAMERCSASRFSEYLSLAQVPERGAPTAPVELPPPTDEILAAMQGGAAPALAEPEPAPSFPAPSYWERLLVDAAVVGGADRWERRLQGLQNELKAQWARSTDDAEKSRIDKQLQGLRGLQDFALPLIARLTALPESATWRVWLDLLGELAASALRYPDPILSALAELHPMEDVGPVGLDEVYCVLEERLRFLHRDPPPDRYGRVFVAGIESARGREFDVVFLPGLAEGIFPKRASEDPLLLDAFRKTIGDLTVQDDRVARERLLLHIGVAAGARLVISYSRIDLGQSRPRVPSFYAIEILRAAEGRLPNVHEFEKTAELATTARLGWPAPADPMDAIDDAEFDLASLDRFQRLPAGQRLGRGRYLMSVNDVVARALRTSWKRWHNKWSNADGINDDAALPVLAEHRLRERSYSPTSLQNFAACPYKFALYSIYGLHPREEAVALEQLDPLTRGSLYHEMQNKLFGRLQDAGLLPVTPARLPRALDVADAVIDEVAAEQAEKLVPAIPRVWNTEIEELRLDIRGYLRHTANHSPDWTPIYTEMQFGLGGGEPAVIIDGFQVRGSVDLVEESNGRLRVTDYKTGKVPSPAPVFVGGGKVLQPVLYSLVVEERLQRPVDTGRLYFATHRGDYKEIEIHTSEVARQNLGEVLYTIDHAVTTGFLPAAPDRDACKQCDYRPVCGGLEERRVRLKPKHRLQSLAALRGLG